MRLPSTSTLKQTPPNLPRPPSIYFIAIKTYTTVNIPSQLMTALLHFNQMQGEGFGLLDRRRFYTSTKHLIRIRKSRRDMILVSSRIYPDRKQKKGLRHKRIQIYPFIAHIIIWILRYVYYTSYPFTNSNSTPIYFWSLLRKTVPFHTDYLLWLYLLLRVHTVRTGLEWPLGGKQASESPGKLPDNATRPVRVTKEGHGRNHSPWKHT